MAAYQQLSSRRGLLYYRPDSPTNVQLSLNPQEPARRLGRIAIHQVHPDLASLGAPQTPHKVAGSRDSALRFLRSVISSNSSKENTATATAPALNPIPLSTPSSSGSSTPAPATPAESGDEMPPANLHYPTNLPGFNAARRGSTPLNPALHRPSLTDSIRVNSSQSASSDTRSRNGSVTTMAFGPDEKPVAQCNGMAVYIRLAEPVLFLQGHDQHDTSSSSTAMLRGTLNLKVSKSTKLKAINLKFRGIATTKWPEGIPPRKVDFEETDTIMSHTWTFYNALFPSADGGSGADHVRLIQSMTNESQSPYIQSSPTASTTHLPHKRLSLQNTPSRSFEKDKLTTVSSVAAKGYRTFHPGEYTYNFELPIDSRLPETITVDLGFVRYDLEASIERAGAFRTNLLGNKEVVMIRAPAENSLEQVEPIAISRNWEDQLHYDIVISGKSFPMGSKVPIAFKLTPLAKVQCHRIKVFVTENTEYFCSGKRVHRMEPTRKIQLFEKRPDGHSTSAYPGSTMRITAGGGVPYDQRVRAADGEEVALRNPTNLLGELEAETGVGPTEMEFNVQLPGCHDLVDADRLHKLHFDTTYSNIQVHHWIKIVMRLSKPDPADATKRRHFEISIDSPLHILSCRASQTNTELPAYSSPRSPDADPLAGLAECACPGAPRRRNSPPYLPLSLLVGREDSHNANTNTNGIANANANATSSGTATNTSPTIASPGLARPPQAHVHGQTRPIHMLRAPSFNPPAWSDDDPPPPLVTPPPQYNDIASPSHGLADYFSRLADAYDDEESDSDDRGSVRGRVNIPLTPGSRVNRSMDLQRNWVPVSH